MIERAALKRNAKQQLKGKWGLAVGSMFVAQLITNIFSISSNIFEKSAGSLSLILNLGTLLFGGAMAFGMAKFALNLTKDKESAKFNDIFSGFNIYLKTLGLFILMVLCLIVAWAIFIIPFAIIGVIFLQSHIIFIILIALGVLLGAIASVIISIMLSQSYFILCDNHEKGIIECLKESARMMKGHKFEYFVLMLSFLGWGILSILTLFIGFLWLAPYQHVTCANYYLALKNGDFKHEGSPYL